MRKVNPCMGVTAIDSGQYNEDVSRTKLLASLNAVSENGVN